MAKLLFKPMYAQELQDPEKVSTIWVKNLNKIVNKMNNKKSLMIDMKPKDAIKLDIVPLDKTYPEETELLEAGLYRYLYQPGEQHRDKKDGQQILSGLEIRIEQNEPVKRVLYYLQGRSDRAFVREELMNASEDSQVPPDWMSEWK